jgi:hypothetical protein
MSVRAAMGAWLGVLGLFGVAMQAGIELSPPLYRLGIGLAEGLFKELEVRCDLCGCDQAHACTGGCHWEPTFALQGVARCSRCATAPRILQPGDGAFAETLLALRGRRPVGDA